MNKDFHYYATYCAAYIAGYNHEESLAICYSAQLVDWCSRTFLKRIGGPSAAATTQLQLELVDARTDILGLQDITQIWASFHFLPYNLKAEKKKASKFYLDKYRLICNPNSKLMEETVMLAKDKSLQAAGLAMHVLADTWAHRYFAGTPSLVINNTNYHFYEILDKEDRSKDRQITFQNNPGGRDDLDKGVYIGTIYQFNERSIMNLGHGRAGHLPDYSFMRYRYLPAWGGFHEIIKDNPSDYIHAFCQMIYALKFLRGDCETFKKDVYDWEAIAPWEDEIKEILERRQLDSSKDWKKLGEGMSGNPIPEFDLRQYQKQYTDARLKDRDKTFLGKFIKAAEAQKNMVTDAIFMSGNRLAGVSEDYLEVRRALQMLRKYK